jgi:hypothetical protein
MNLSLFWVGLGLLVAAAGLFAVALPKAGDARPWLDNALGRALYPVVLVGLLAWGVALIMYSLAVF